MTWGPPLSASDNPAFQPCSHRPGRPKSWPHQRLRQAVIHFARRKSRRLDQERDFDHLVPKVVCVHVKSVFAHTLTMVGRNHHGTLVKEIPFLKALNQPTNGLVTVSDRCIIDRDDGFSAVGG